MRVDAPNIHGLAAALKAELESSETFSDKEREIGGMLIDVFAALIIKSMLCEMHLRSIEAALKDHPAL